MRTTYKNTEGQKIREQQVHYIESHNPSIHKIIADIIWSRDFYFKEEWIYFILNQETVENVINKCYYKNNYKIIQRQQQENVGKFLANCCKYGVIERYDLLIVHCLIPKKLYYLITFLPLNEIIGTVKKLQEEKIYKIAAAYIELGKELPVEYGNLLMKLKLGTGWIYNIAYNKICIKHTIFEIVKEIISYTTVMRVPCTEVTVYDCLLPVFDKIDYGIHKKSISEYNIFYSYFMLCRRYVTFAHASSPDELKVYQDDSVVWERVCHSIRYYNEQNKTYALPPLFSKILSYYRPEFLSVIKQLLIDILKKNANNIEIFPENIMICILDQNEIRHIIENVTESRVPLKKYNKYYCITKDNNIEHLKHFIDKGGLFNTIPEKLLTDNNIIYGLLYGSEDAKRIYMEEHPEILRFVLDNFENIELPDAEKKELLEILIKYSRDEDVKNIFIDGTHILYLFEDIEQILIKAPKFYLLISNLIDIDREILERVGMRNKEIFYYVSITKFTNDYIKKAVIKYGYIPFQYDETNNKFEKIPDGIYNYINLKSMKNLITINSSKGYISDYIYRINEQDELIQLLIAQKGESIYETS